MLLICNGMLRSGSTLQYNIARTILARKAQGGAKGFFFLEEFQHYRKKFAAWAKSQKYYIIKTHDIIPNLEELEKEGFIKILYIYRDIRNVAISLKRMLESENADLYGSIDKAISVFYKIKTHKQLLMQRYEDVILNRSNAIKEIADFCNIKLTEKEVFDIEKECSVENFMKIANKKQGIMVFIKKQLLNSARNMNAKEILQHLKIPQHIIVKLRKPFLQIDKHTLLHPDHISNLSKSCKPFYTELSDDEIHTLTNRHLHWMIENKYLTDDKFNDQNPV